MSEQAKIAAIQEVIKEARTSERNYDIMVCGGLALIAIGLCTRSYYKLSLVGDWFFLSLAFIGVCMIIVGAWESHNCNRIKNGAIRQLNQMATRTTCPKCGKETLQANYGFCPFCRTELKKQ